MNRLASLVAERYHAALSAILAISAVVGVLVWTLDYRLDRHERVDWLANQAERRSLELMSLTMNGSLMGSMSLLGLIDWELKREVKGETEPNMTSLVSTFESIGRAHKADGVFSVGGDGIIKSSWDNSGKPSTGIDVRFRPYYQMAMQGKDSVYAAVSMARGDRSIYFTTAVHAGTSPDDKAIGGVVARTGISGIEELLRRSDQIALLLSPQGVVFASGRTEFVGHVAGALTQERLKAIRELKQFGAAFEKTEPPTLPFDITSSLQRIGGRMHAVAVVPVRWNDPQGEWRLVLLDDLDASLPMLDTLWIGLIGAAGAFALLYMFLNVLRSQHAQARAATGLRTLAAERETSAANKSRLASASLRLQQCATLGELGQKFLSEMHELAGTLQGVIYLTGEKVDAPLQLLASYGCSVPPPVSVAPGESMVGQCALDREEHLIDRPDGDYWKIASGLGQATPAAGLIVPLLLQDRFVGVLEVAMLTQPDTSKRELIRDFAAVLAVNVEIQRRSAQIESVLADTAAAESKNSDLVSFQQALIDAIPYPVFYKGPDTRFLGFNRAYEDAFGVRREDLVGKRVLDLEYLPLADRETYQAEDEATMESVGTVKRQMKMPYSDGTVRDTMYFVSGFRRGDGTPGGLVGTFIDLTGRG